MSEGINFADDLARGIIVLGLPYPNVKSAELKEKMQFYDMRKKLYNIGISGAEYYENLCIKTIN